MKLEQAIGRYVRVEKEEGNLQLSVCGTLAFLEDDNMYYVYISDDPRGHGVNDVSFRETAVRDIIVQGSGIVDIII